MVEKSDIYNFGDDDTIYSYGSDLPLILSNLELDMENLLLWFKVISLKVNLRKSEFMILNKICYKHFLDIGSITVKESDEVELLGITFDKALTFKRYIQN